MSGVPFTRKTVCAFSCAGVLPTRECVNTATSVGFVFFLFFFFVSFGVQFAHGTGELRARHFGANYKTLVSAVVPACLF